MTRPARGEVIDLGAIRKARRVEEQAVDMVAAWQARRLQLTGEAEALAREVGAHAVALDEAVARFAAAGRAATARLGEILLQIEDINTAIDHWRRADTPPAGDVDGAGG